jgi:hypothetical protein
MVTAKLGAALVVVAACGGRAHPTDPLRAEVEASDDLTLYRDWSLVRQRIGIDVASTTASVKLVVPIGVTIDQVVVVDRGGLTFTLHDVAAEAATAAARSAGSAGSGSAEDDLARLLADDSPTPPGPTDPPAGTPTPTELRLDVVAPRAGHYTIQLAYVTEHLKWDAAYTMTTSPARDRAALRGAVAIRNITGIEFHHATARVVDAELGAARSHASEHLATTLVGTSPSTTPTATPRELGAIDLGAGETRVELLHAPPPRRMRSVLVYDPIGTALDQVGASPSRDPQLGVGSAAPTRVTESFEVARDERVSAGLPAGPVRLLERRSDGSLAVLGESQLFDAATRVAEADTIAIGTADGVTGHRERRELTIDDQGNRLVEEFAITIDNARSVPVGVLIREHLYRGQNWTLAYDSASSHAKEGPQQISLRTDVPAKGQAKILYVVVYKLVP